MAIREFQIVSDNNVRSKLTITPTRITLKFSSDIKEEDKPVLVSFVNRVEAEMGEIIQSWRGRIRVSDTSVGVELQTDNNKQCRKFYIDRSTL